MHSSGEARDLVDLPLDVRPRVLPWIGPAAAGVGALAACVVVAVHDPNVKGSYGLCPFKAVTGLDCPGCGLLRGTHALLNGQFERAIDHNIFLPAVFVLAIVGYLRWLGRSLGRDIPRWHASPSAIVGLTTLIFGFWVLRNLSAGPFEYLYSTAT